MATVVLQAAGTVLGSVFGPIGSIVGRAAGALAGAAIDNRVFGGGGEDKVFGRARVSGQVIWATDLEEVITEEEVETGGGKGGPRGGSTTQRTYSYFGNFAIALCEGEVAQIGRVWLDGELLDVNEASFRFYKGTENQQPDSLIEAKQGAGNAPAYRGISYIVFERLPLADYGNRLPQVSCEIVKPIGRLEKEITAVNLIPGASEFAYSPDVKVERLDEWSAINRNRNTTRANSDWKAAVDDLQTLCPNVRSVSLVVAWFGSDLRCGDCRIVPKVETASRNMTTTDWQVAGIDRGNAELVSKRNGSPAYGGTPSDESVIAAIQDLKARGLKVFINPFIMMDVAEGNTLPNPYSGNIGQAVYPWRGRITTSLAAEVVGSVDKTAAARSEVQSFVHGSDGFRRFILHYANLCVQAGGVDGFLLCSELRGLTWIRDENGYPFVNELVGLAAEVRNVLGNDTFLTYGADWSEYFGHQPADGNGDVGFHLDPLWAHPAISAIGIDNYMPLSDWRDEDGHADEEWGTGTSYSYLAANIEGGEGFDWYYANEVDRERQVRTPITDGAYNRPWVYRYKDIRSWWSNQHFNRIGGVEAATPTPWLPQSKPIFINEVGCPALDKGANQPNVFFDPKSSESAVPYYSSGVRQDGEQRRMLEVVLDYWRLPQNNPVSQIYGGPMLLSEEQHIWTWDARPFPAFPLRRDVWTDGANHNFGHWLNGRMGGVPLKEFIEEIFRLYAGISVSAENVADTVDGFVISDRVSARDVLTELLNAFRIVIFERAGHYIATPIEQLKEHSFNILDVVDGGGDAAFSVRSEQAGELPAAVTYAFWEINRDYRATTSASRRLEGVARDNKDTELSVVSSHDRMVALAEQRLQSLWKERDAFIFALPPSALRVEVGDAISISRDSLTDKVLIKQIEDGTSRKLEGQRLTRFAPRVASTTAEPLLNTPKEVAVRSKPVAELLDLPLLPFASDETSPWIAAAMAPWPGELAIYGSGSANAYRLLDTKTIPDRIGRLLAPLTKGACATWDEANEVHLTISGGALSSKDDLTVFAGANTLAIECLNGGWELLQFSQASLQDDGSWKLSRLLRGQLGTQDAMEAGAGVGANCVLISPRLQPLDLNSKGLQEGAFLKLGSARQPLSDDYYTALSFEPTYRSFKPLAPVHVKAKRAADSGDVALSWIRRTRLNGDAWSLAEVPLAEDSEAYQVEIIHTVTGVSVRTVRTTAPEFFYPTSDQIQDFGELPEEISIELAQLSASHGVGIKTARSFTL